MRTGRDVLDQATLSVHCRAIITGATAVFTQDLCKHMFSVESHSGEYTMSSIAKACAYHLLQSPKYTELEGIVSAVLESPDGMPDIANKALLAEVLQVYSQSAAAERAGHAAQFRQNTLVPALVEQAYEDSSTFDISAVCEKVEEFAAAWEAYVPETAFQHIVRQAINDICV